MNHLVDLRDAVLFDRLVTDETKHDLVAENNRIINLLLKLPDREKLSKSSEEKNKNDDEPPTKKQIGRWHLNSTGWLSNNNHNPLIFYSSSLQSRF